MSLENIEVKLDIAHYIVHSGSEVRLCLYGVGHSGQILKRKATSSNEEAERLALLIRSRAANGQEWKSLFD